MRRRAMFCALCALSLGLWIQSVAIAAAQDNDVAGFFRGKQVTLYIGTAVGGGYDAYARLIGRHIGAYIPGSPSVVPVNMPGAGGAILIVHLLTSAARDGTVIAALQPGAMTAPLYTDKTQYDARSLVYLGSANSEDDLCWIRADAPVESYSDVFSKEIILGGAAPGDTTVDLPTVQNNVLGTRFKIVSGYAGSNEVLLAMDKNEVQGLCGVGLPSMMAQRPSWVTGGFVKILVQENSDGSPKLNQQNIPRSVDFSKTDEDRKVLDLIYVQQKFGRPYAMPPGAPPARVAALRSAFLQVLQDKDLIAEALKMNLDIKSMSGQELQQLIGDIYATPPSIVSRARGALSVTGSK